MVVWVKSSDASHAIRESLVPSNTKTCQVHTVDETHNAVRSRTPPINDTIEHKLRIDASAVFEAEGGNGKRAFRVARAATVDEVGGGHFLSLSGWTVQRPKPVLAPWVCGCWTPCEAKR